MCAANAIRAYIEDSINNNILTAPVNISYINAPNDHQSTALPWPLLVKISGALFNREPIIY